METLRVGSVEGVEAPNADVGSAGSAGAQSFRNPQIEGYGVGVAVGVAVRVGVAVDLGAPGVNVLVFSF